MQKEIEDLKNGQTARRREELNELDPLFIKEIASTPVTKKFKMLQITLYDGLGNLVEHIENYQDWMKVHRANQALLGKGFPLSLTRSAQAWYKKLEPSSISSFKQILE